MIGEFFLSHQTPPPPPPPVGNFWKDSILDRVRLFVAIMNIQIENEALKYRGGANRLIGQFSKITAFSYEVDEQLQKVLQNSYPAHAIDIVDKAISLTLIVKSTLML